MTYTSVNNLVVNVSTWPAYGDIYYSVWSNSIAPIAWNGATNQHVLLSGSGILRGQGAFQFNVSPGVGANDYVGLNGQSTDFRYSQLQLSLAGPIGSRQSPFIVRPNPALDDAGPPEQAQEGENVVGYQLAGSGLGIDEFLWTSSNPADLLPDAAAAARSLAINPLELELVTDITGPRVTSIIFDALLASIVPTLLLEIGDLEIPVTLGQEVDLTQYDPTGVDHFNLHISGISDWSALPNDWFLTGYKFAGSGNVLVQTRAVPEINVLSLSAIVLVLFACAQCIRRGGSHTG